MDPLDPTHEFRARRRLLGTLAAGLPAAALLAGAASAAAAPEPPEAPTPEELFAAARLRSYKSRRSSSWDRTGGNADWFTVDPGQSATVLDVSGSGVVTHIWFTINSPDPMHLKNLVLRAWWDGEVSPSVEVPIGDFFGLGLGEYFLYQSALTRSRAHEGSQRLLQNAVFKCRPAYCDQRRPSSDAQPLLRRRLHRASFASRGTGSLSRAVPAGRALQGCQKRRKESGWSR